MSEVEAPVKPTSLDLPVQNGGTVEEIEERKPIILNGSGWPHHEVIEIRTLSPLSPTPDLRSPSALSQGRNGFLVSFMVDARGGTHRGRRHSGVDVHIPQNRVCQPTRVTCRLIRREKAPSLPKLFDGETLASRVLETGPARAQFSGSVRIDVPHFASLREGEREIVIMRSDDGVTWYEHKNLPPPTEHNTDKTEDDEDDEDDKLAQKQVAKIFTSDFPKYFVAVTRLFIDQAVVGPKGSTLKSTVVPQVQVTFQQKSVNKDTKIGLQVLPVSNTALQKTLGRLIPVSPVTTIEPRRRRFHEPITLTIPIPRGATMPNPKTKPDAQALKILYSLSGSTSPPVWEDITGSAALNIVNNSLSFATTLSARFWLIDCVNVTDVVGTAKEVYNESIVVPFLARFHVFMKRHTATQAQIRVLCLTDESPEKTFEAKEGFAEIARSDVVEVLEDRPSYLTLDGAITLSAKHTVQPSLMFHSFRVNRLSFVVRCSAHQASPGTISFSREQRLEGDPRGVLCSIPLTLAAFDGDENERPMSPDQEPEIYQQRFDAALSSAAATKATLVGKASGDIPPPLPGMSGLKLAEVAKELHGDWVPLAAQLGITPREILKIQSEYGDTEEQAMLMLHLWVEKAGMRATSSQLESALKRIGREDLIPSISNNNNTTPEVPKVATPESQEVNPIDSPANADDVARVLDFDTSERSMLFDAEPGAEYDLEQVWDGKEWHKKRLSKTFDEPHGEDHVDKSHNTTDSEPVVEQAVQQQLVNHTGSAPEPFEVEAVVELNGEEKLESAVSAATTGVQPYSGLDGQNTEIEVNPSLPAGVPEPGLDEPENELNPSLPASVPESGLDGPENESSDTSRPKSLELREGNIMIPEIHIEEAGVTEGDTEREEEEVLEDGTVVIRKIRTSHTVSPPSLTITTPDGSKNFVDEESFDGSADGITVTHHSVVDGDPTVTTEVEETEETLEDGTVVSRKLVRTKQVQNVITNVVVEGPEGTDLDQIAEEVIQGINENQDSANTTVQKSQSQKSQKNQKKKKSKK